MAAILKYEPSEEQHDVVPIAHFGHGHLKKPDDERIKFYMYGSTKKDVRRGNHRLLVAETSEQSYVGKNFGPEASHKPLCKHYVGVLDKRSYVMTIHEAELFNLKPTVVTSTTTAEERDDDVETPEDSYIQKFSDMVKAFGTSRQKRSLAAQELSRSSLQNAGVAMASTMEQLATDDPSLAVPAAPVANIPPFDIDATEPADAYKIGSIITPTEEDCLRGYQKCFAQADKETIDQWREGSRYGEYIMRHVAHLPSYDEERNRLSRLLLYLSALIQLYNVPPKVAARKGVVLSDIPSILQSRLYSLFTVESEISGKKRYTVPGRLRDRLVAYIFVVALHVENFDFDAALLIRDLSLTPSRAAEYFRSIGCSVITNGSRKRKSMQDSDSPGADGLEPEASIRVRLKIPLTFPGKKRGRSRH
ncbi:DNA-directed RNA polymerase I subunit RPA49-like [Sycon ciliatum]|uniref:DNA-directed RNA polymerase I subunit RPA49-like n=1 Tax=Sycon ciliatum TaxID=27933 RepID=UPI0031F721FA|eukprot:scpid23317/ scgid16211/ DNA-directed RNA polymerase I subunit RPA49; DNA-directed RNA polymerase I subunit E; RNA polymerase I-associated factor 1; RNA polymerase I-associated factor 53